METALILVVEPDATLRDVLCDLLGFWGMRVEAAATVAEAIALVERDRPDGAILNLWPTVGDATALVRSLKGRSDPAGVPVIALGDGVDDARARAALAAGADAVVGVPFELVDLELRLRRLVPGAARTGAFATWPETDGLTRLPGLIAGSSEQSLSPLALALLDNVARVRHQRELSRWLRARGREQRLLARRLRAVAVELRAQRPRRLFALDAASA